MGCVSSHFRLRRLQVQHPLRDLLGGAVDMCVERLVIESFHDRGSEGLVDVTGQRTNPVWDVRPAPEELWSRMN